MFGPYKYQQFKQSVVMIKKNINGFSKLNREQRYQKLLEWGLLSADEMAHLKQGSPIPFDLAEHFIENVIGFFQMPLGIVPHFVIDKRPYVVPMAVEETSIIAAVSKAAKWVKENGFITTTCKGHLAIGQIQIAKVKNKKTLEHFLQSHKAELLKKANHFALNLHSRGGGFQDATLRLLPREDQEMMGVIHLYVNTVDAMGANIINQVCEGLKPWVEKMTGEQVTMCIVSNLSDTKCVQATVVLEKIDLDLAYKIAEASYFAQIDPYRATTNNKGVLNGIDPILIATGNDWRAVEAGVHAYASRSGHYTSLTRWTVESGCLKGVLEVPMSLGIVGGVTGLHPTAQLCLKMLGVSSAEHLSRVVTAVGLVQNLGALRALSTVGVVQGHINLHISNLAMMAGATPSEIPILQEELQKLLLNHKKVSVSEAELVLKDLRQQKLQSKKRQDHDQQRETFSSLL